VGTAHDPSRSTATPPSTFRDKLDNLLTPHAPGGDATGRPDCGPVATGPTRGQQTPRHSAVTNRRFPRVTPAPRRGLLNREVLRGTWGRHFLSLVSQVRILPWASNTQPVQVLWSSKASAEMGCEVHAGSRAGSTLAPQAPTGGVRRRSDGGIPGDDGMVTRAPDRIGAIRRGNSATRGGVVGAELGGCRGGLTSSDRGGWTSWRQN